VPEERDVWFEKETLVEQGKRVDNAFWYDIVRMAKKIVKQEPSLIYRDYSLARLIYNEIRK